MKVITARSAGFCWGVSRAISKARDAVSAAPPVILTDGPLIHNKEMIERLRSEGINDVSDPDKAGGRPMMIRAHGISPKRRHFLKSLCEELIDATCPDVARIQGQIRKYVRKGFDIVIFGDAGHAEVEGLMGYAEGHGYVVGSPENVADLPELGAVCLVSQSTQFPEDYASIADSLRARFDDVEVLDTICEATKNRQREVEDLASKVDAIVVVGGAHSANTVRLMNQAASLRRAFHVQTASQLEARMFKDCSVVGLTAGASTPDFIIDEVRQKLEAM